MKNKNKKSSFPSFAPNSVSGVAKKKLASSSSSASGSVPSSTTKPVLSAASYSSLPSSVSWQAGFMSLGSLISRLSGFLRDVCIASLFSKTETDIFFVAFRLPNFFRRLLGEGSFSASVTPALTEHLQRKEGEMARSLSHSLFIALFCISSLLSFVGILFMEPLMELFLSGSSYALIEGKMEKTVLAGRVVFSYLFFVSLYAYFMSVAQAYGRFFLPALAPAALNLSLIAFAWSPKSWWAFPSLSLSWAVLLGGLLQLLPVLYEMSRLNLWPSKNFFHFNGQEVLKVGKRFLPAMIGLSGLSLIGMINVYFSVRLEEGAPSYIYYGDRLLEFPRALIALSLGTALVPELTQMVTRGELGKMKESVLKHSQLMLFFTLPCALAFALSAEPILELLFKRGEFGSSEVLKTAEVLQIYSLVLIFSSLSRILSSCFFALNKNKALLVCVFAFVCFHLFCVGILSTTFGLRGLAGGTALSYLFYFFVLLSLLFRLTGRWNLFGFAPFLLKLLPGLFVLALCLLALPWLRAWFSLLMLDSLALFFALSGTFSIGALLYVWSSAYLGEEFALACWGFFKKSLALLLKKIKAIPS